jgi:hypothetical protein
MGNTSGWATHDFDHVFEIISNLLNFKNEEVFYLWFQRQQFVF